MAITATMLLMLTGLVLDGGGRLRAIERADALAQEAARAAGQQIDQAALLQGQGLRLDVGPAEAAASSYLAANGITGSTFQLVDNTIVKITFTTKYHTALLGLVGLDEISVQGSGQSRLVPGVSTADPAPTGGP
ncbi:hypothetical protein ACEZDB_16800 [Streptacidiphilus sp. N1-3]|uniref:Flp pilus-assembly TadE/G-like n=1 Tax=Streptacidiphilus alkalitolerans TaxID=3342712 RepID=A0ABV6X1Y5_9ACTN